MAHLLLCSASPRRRELLARVGLAFEVVAPNVDESRICGELVTALPLRLAQLKARAGLALHRARGGADAIALAADTVVSMGESELGKPRDRLHARELLAQMSGQEHLVTTGVCVLSAAGVEASCTVDTKVRFRALTDAQLDWLALSGDGDDKAGGYGLQGLAGALIDRLDGSFTNVIGLPMGETLELLAGAGVKMPWTAMGAALRAEDAR
jgi:septum formation protein